ncbi:hypothetical protein SKAU_G00334300 [Synaphobranchus kaupii]|uniref:Uncharacterized protein n=1 Tax=Synaphobranchus kaupii TaxID=118154 RepID=A0A9Q1ELU2_SYNKA|nr:hypothetical protein SKAU_G00334300 [Synaphobranchus kaupii]
MLRVRQAGRASPGSRGERLSASRSPLKWCHLVSPVSGASGRETESEPGTRRGPAPPTLLSAAVFFSRSALKGVCPPDLPGMKCHISD